MAVVIIDMNTGEVLEESTPPEPERTPETLRPPSLQMPRPMPQLQIITPESEVPHRRRQPRI